jgi:dipeptidyl aminopeptidase/acylaminoacyl peptidase
MAWLKTKRPRGPKSSRLYEDMVRPADPELKAASWRPIATLVAFTLLMAGVSVAFFLYSQPLLGVGFLLVGVLPSVLTVAVANAQLTRDLGPRPAPDDDELGDVLGDAGDELVRSLSGSLLGPELAKLEEARAREAASTRSWLDALPDGVAFETVEVTSDDGTHLVGHALACAPDPARWLVFAHGLDGTWRAGMTFARNFAEKGFNLLFVELRAHGSSGGAWVGTGWLDRRDLVAWSRWVARRAGSDARVVLMGQSMGAAAVLMAAAEEDLAPQVVACVSEASYADWWNLALNRFTQTHTNPGTVRRSSPHPFLDVERLLLKSKPDGYDLTLSRPVDAIAHARVPVLLIQDAGDRMVPAHMARKLNAAAAADHELLVVESAGHCLGAIADPEAYFTHVLSFAERYA